MVCMYKYSETNDAFLNLLQNTLGDSIFNKWLHQKAICFDHLKVAHKLCGLFIK